MPRKRAEPANEAKKIGRPTKYDPAYCDMVIEDMSKGYSLTAFAGLIGVSRATLNVWMDEHPEFLEAVTRAKAMRLRNWEDVALKMRTNGGGPGGATITVFGLKNMGGDEWSDTQKVSLSGPNGGPVQVQKIEWSVIDPSSSDSEGV